VRGTASWTGGERCTGAELCRNRRQIQHAGPYADLSAAQQIRTNDLIAIYNLGITGASAYNGDNVARVSNLASDSSSGTEETTITLAAPTQFPLESGTRRFHVIPVEENVVAYVCTGGTLRRLVTPGVITGTAPLFTNSANSYCGTTAQLATAPVIANNLSSCAFTYNGSDLQRNGLVQISLGITSEGESVTLFHQIHVNNTP